MGAFDLVSLSLLAIKKLGTTNNMLEWVHTTNKHQNDFFMCMHVQEPTLLI